MNELLKLRGYVKNVNSLDGTEGGGEGMDVDIALLG